MKKTLIIDGNSIINRAFFGIKVLNTKDGFPTNALYGMMTMIERQLELLSPDYAAIAFDVHEPTFRHKMYDAYKAGRRPTPDDLLKQFPVAKELAEALGLVILEKGGFEADDILGTVAKLSEQNGAAAYVMTGDRDSLQLISENTHVLLAKTGETVEYTQDFFYEQFGVRPDQFIDVKALMGDSSDNIPGVRGIGEKTAFNLIARFGSLEGIYAEYASSDLSQSVKDKLSTGYDSAILSQKLATIVCDVPLGITMDTIAYQGMHHDDMVTLCRRLEFTAMLKRLESEQASPEISVVAPSITEETADENTILALPDVPLGISFEDESMHVYDGEKAWKYPLSQPEFSKTATAFFMQHKKLIVYDAKSVYLDLEKRGVHWRNAYRDVMLGAYIVNSNAGKYSLPDLVSVFLKTSVVSEVPFSYYVFELEKNIQADLVSGNQTQILEEIEMPLCAVLADMEIEGFKIDTEGIKRYGRQLQETAAQLEEKIYEYAGMTFNVNSPKQLGEVLFEKLSLPHGKKTKTGYSTNAEILDKLKYYHPIIPAILEYRQVTKLNSTYADGLVKVADNYGVIHTTFNQTGTATGRLSSSEPNLQNIPVRTDLGRELRRFFIPKNSTRVLIDADYSQIELRLLAHIARDPAMTKAFQCGLDIHTSTAATVFHLSPDEVTSEIRKKAKAINFGILYGMGDYSLADDLGITRLEAKEYINQYLSTYPLIDAYLDSVIEYARDTGYVTTMMGRRRYIPEIKNTNKNVQHFGERVAMNSPIQGTAADIIKIAMIKVHHKLEQAGIDAKLILQIHDELIIDASKECAEQALKILCEEMESAVALSVPLSVDAHIGDNWLSAK